MNTPVMPAVIDGQAPTAPAGLTATGSIGQAQLSWTAASDNIGVARYNVHRGTSAGFTPTTGNRIAQPTGTSYTDSGLAAGTCYYRVTAAGRRRERQPRLQRGDRDRDVRHDGADRLDERPGRRAP